MSNNRINQVRRLYSVKKPGFDVEAQGILQDLKLGLGVKRLRSVRIFNRYDVVGLDDQAWQQARNLVFSEPPVDEVWDEPCDFGQPDAVIAVEALPGQYDQRADSAAQCLQILTQGVMPQCRTARIFALHGDLSQADAARIKDWLINPVESREASLKLPQTLDQDLDAPKDIGVVEGLRDMTGSALNDLRQSAGLAMSNADLELVRDYFAEQGRDPTWTELRVLDTYWSDHCRHTTFLTEITDVTFPEGTFGDRLRAAWKDYLDLRSQNYGTEQERKPVCLMDLATIGARQLRRAGLLDDLDISPEVNACTIRATVQVDGKPEAYLILFKNETHNHPTEIEPFGGAATCLGGAIRDPLSGRAYVYQAMRVTGSGNPTVPVSETLPGKLPQRKITTTAAAGYSSYGNQIGLATGLVDELYHPGYIAKRMEIGAVIGAVPADQVRREEPKDGDLVLLIGGRTGRDGCGGATGSSKAHDDQSLLTCGSEVQKGNPPTERKLQRLFRNPEAARLIKRCNDFGAGGVSVAVGELAAGLAIDLDQVLRKYEGLDGTELAISESQERMAVVVAAQDAPAMLEAAAAENLEAAVIAQVTAEPRMTMSWRGDMIVDLERAFIDTHGARQQASARVIQPQSESWFCKAQQYGSFSVRLRKRLGELDACSRLGLAERFDSTIGAGTVLMPYGGRLQLTPEQGMAALIPMTNGHQTNTTSLMTYGFDPWLSAWSPFHGAAYAVLESLARITALGGNPRQARLTFQEYFERMRSEESWGLPLAALLGALQAQMGCGVASIGGKDSMSGSFNDLHVPPTLVSFAVCLTTAERVVSSALSDADQSVWLIPVPLEGERPASDPASFPDCARFMDRLDQIAHWTQERRLAAAASVRGDGIAPAVVRMCLGNQLGFSFAQANPVDALFAPQAGALLIAFKTQPDAGEKSTLERLDARLIGITTGEQMFRHGESCLPWSEALHAWRMPLEPVFPMAIPIHAVTQVEIPVDTFLEEEQAPVVCRKKLTNLSKPVIRTHKAKPRVLIPVFPGTNCEYDSERAFLAAGGEPRVFIFRNRNSADLRETLAELEREIRQAQIVFLPGGFSAGDEPEGSGKFIAAAFRNPRISAAVNDLLQQRDGLMLGICNGFQALIKLGLFLDGCITDLTADSPTLTFNRIGRHVSTCVTTRLMTTRSPWLTGMAIGDCHLVPVSHGEGRLTATPEVLRQLQKRDQIATVYVDANGQQAAKRPDNPSESMAGIEGLLSPDGRVFGKMAHSERTGSLLMRNVPGVQAHQIFHSGVRYYA